MPSSLRTVIGRLGTGLLLLLTLGIRPRRLRSAESGAEPVWLAGLAIAIWAARDWLAAEADRSFDAVGLATTLAACAVLIGVLSALRSDSRRFDAHAVASVIAAASVWLGVLAIAAMFAWQPIIDRLAIGRALQQSLWQGFEIAAAAWFLLVVWQIGRIGSIAEPRKLEDVTDSSPTEPAGLPARKRIGGWLVAGCLAAGLALPSRPLFDGAAADPGTSGLLHMAVRYVGTAMAKPPPPRARPPRIDVEAVYYSQPGLMRKALAGLSPSRAERPEIYFVGAATFAGQAVFMREVQTARSIVDERFGTHGRSMLLINNRDTLASVPLANTANLTETLTALSSIMDPEKDLLFLYITSHGSPGEIAVQLPGFSPNQITPEGLRQMLAASNIKNRLVVISACYSGSFIPALEGPDTVVLTAARPDRTSFGCSDERDWTYFGDAFFNHALRQTHSFTDAFGLARKLVARWEAEQKVDASEPQIAAGARAVAKIDEITALFAGAPAASGSR